MKLKAVLPYILFLFINNLFIIKYLSRQDQLNEYLLALGYTFIIGVSIYSYSKIPLKQCHYKVLFYIATVCFFALTVYMNITVNGYALNTDRWSAMHFAIKALFNGEHPYAAIDHLGGRTSNLPSLIFIGIPFYFLGNIGLLQSFSFLVFIYVLSVIFDNYKDRLFTLLLLIASPSYFWEIYAKSDLMSNFIILLMFLIIVQNKFSENKQTSPYGLSFFSTALLLTRLTAIIPISLLLFKKFWNYSIKEKIQFVLMGILTLSLFTYICFNKVEDFEYFKKYNPFTLQNRQLPLLISFTTILIPLFYSFKIINIKSLIKASVSFLFIPISIAFFLTVIEKGWQKSIINSFFDISYLNILMPFLLILLTFNYKSYFQKGIKTIQTIKNQPTKN